MEKLRKWHAPKNMDKRELSWEELYISLPQEGKWMVYTVFPGNREENPWTLYDKAKAEIEKIEKIPETLTETFKNKISDHYKEA